MTDLKSMTLEEITAALRAMGEPSFRGKQVFTWLHRGITDFDEMMNIPKSLREKLRAEYYITVPTVARKQVSKLDGTIKYLWELQDGNCIETVLMSYHHGNTVCISSQVGCRMGCKFCASTLAGKVRDLTPSEMLDQVLFTQLDSGREISNIVLMGIGEPMDNLPFTIYAYCMADYFAGSYVPRHRSHEMSMRMQQKVEENGAQFELRQEVEKILVKDGKVRGVRTKRGDEIACDYVICGAYPNRVYTQMIEPLSEVPAGAIRFVNGNRLSVCPVSVMLILEGTPEENGITNYNTFSGDTMDTNAIWRNNCNLTEPYNFLTTVCLNYANPDCVPAGYTHLSITNLVPVDPFLGVKEEEYYDLKRRLANEMMEQYIKIGGVDFRGRIAEIEVSTPMTISHYVGAWKGSIYGYSHSMDNHVVAKKTMMAEDHFIDGLEFAGAHAVAGDGQGPQITNGRAAAKAVLDAMAAKEAAK